SRWLVVVTFIGASVCTSPAAQRSDNIFDRWAKSRAAPIKAVELSESVADLRRLKPIIGAARVVALGEPTHGAHEPLAFRNRLFRYLVEVLGFTAIAIESGLPDSRPIFDFVAGRPGTARQVVRGSLTCGLGAYQENEDLAQWMREYNAKAVPARKVRFYSIDLGRCGEGTPLAFENAITYLTRVDPASGQRMRATFQPYLDRLSAPNAAPLSQTESDSLSAAIEDLLALLERERLTFIAATSEADYEWAHRNAIVARQAHRLYRVSPYAPGGGGRSSAWRGLNQRDGAMADNVRWVLEREGPTGRVLVFAHNGHVMNAPAAGEMWKSFAFERPPTAMGQHLRSALGADLVIIGVSSAENGTGLPTGSLEPGGLDAALSRLGPPLFILDLRAALSDRALAAWLAEPRQLRANFTTSLTVSPSVAFDALLFVNTLTPARNTSQ
ncbi:MAG TPA: erythromycin esterase family protein, partial [Blastocatellia bacterium]